MWQKLLAREGVDLPTISGLDAVFFEHLEEFRGKREELFFTLFKDRRFTHFVAVDSHAWGQFVYRKYFRSPKDIHRYYETGKKLLRGIRKETSEWKKRKLDSKSRLHAWRKFRKQFEQVNRVYSITSWLGIESWQHDLEQLVSAMIKRGHSEAIQETILASVYRPWKKTALTEIQKGLEAGQSPSALAEKYQFLRSWAVVWNRPLDEKWIRDLFPSKEKISVLNKKELFKALKPNSNEKKFLEMVPFMIFFKDWRDDLRRRHAFEWGFLFAEIAAHFRIAADDVGYLTSDEIESAIENDLWDKSLIADRKMNGCVVTKDFQSNRIVASRKIPFEYQTIVDQVESALREHQLKGLTAYPGVVRGKVVIIESYHDLKKVDAESILVANTTHPNYLPAMHKAAAFVTNEGGMISHAAIVARELKKPCIVGTKTATKLLKTGDFVEVDATRGIVKVLKRSE